MESIKKIAQKSGAGMNLKQIFKRLDLDGNGVLDRQLLSFLSLIESLK